MFYVSLDLGQSQDPTALAILEEITTGEGDDIKYSYHCRYLERFPLGTRYVKIVQEMKKKLESDVFKDGYVFLVDKTGVGAGIVELFQEADLAPVGIIITSGHRARRDDNGDWFVPKKDLVHTTLAMLESGRLKIAPGMQDVDVLIEELMNFKVRISKANNDVYSARTGKHDDLVLALAMGAWYADRQGGGIVWFFG